MEGRIPQLAWPSWPSSQVVETASSQDGGMDLDTDADEDDYDDDDENDDEGTEEEEGQHDEYNLVNIAKRCYNPPGVAFHPGWLCPRLRT